jgi:regulator of replication initiation timing
MAKKDGYRVKFHASSVRAIVPVQTLNRVTLVLEIDMGKRADSWKIIRQLISDRNDEAGSLVDENKRLRTENQTLRDQISRNVADPSDDADKQADIEMQGLAAAVMANKAGTAGDTIAEEKTPLEETNAKIEG